MMNIIEAASLKKLNTFGMDVKADYLSEVNTSEDIEQVLEFREKKNIPLFILGGGSNILFSREIHELVLLNRLKGIELIEENQKHVWVQANAGENWHEFVLFCLKNNWGGVENLSLIPGNVGASPMQNIGAYGVEIKDVFHSLEAINLKDGKAKEFSAEECRFGYRESVFKQEEKGKWLITKVNFKLTKVDHILKTGYGAITTELEAMHVKTANIQAISEAVIRIRRSKLPNPEEIGNAGSFFKNPVVDISIMQQIKRQHPDVVSYPAGENQVKLAAGWLIEKAGWKGYRKGDAGVHKNQALVLVNYGQANGNEISDLADSLIEDIQKKFGVMLEKEVNIY